MAQNEREEYSFKLFNGDEFKLFRGLSGYNTIYLDGKDFTLFNQPTQQISLLAMKEVGRIITISKKAIRSFSTPKIPKEAFGKQKS